MERVIAWMIVVIVGIAVLGVFIMALIEAPYEILFGCLVFGVLMSIIWASNKLFI